VTELEWTRERAALWGVANFKQAQRLLAEPPRGNNHGIARSDAGGLRDLSTRGEPLEADGYDVDSFISHRKTFKRPRSKKPFDTIRHGKLSGYTNDKCRCSECKTAMREYFRKRRAKSVDNRKGQPS
jgi:hypothetical protein